MARKKRVVRNKKSGEIKKSYFRRSLKEDYKEAFGYVKESLNYISFVVLLFIFISVIVFSGVQSERLNQSFNEAVKKIVLEFEGLNLQQTIFKIFVNNSFASFLGIVLGIFFGVISLSFVFINAYLIGYVASLAVKEEGFRILFSLVPHGIFELPAVFISFALGIKLGMFFLSKNPWKELIRRAEESMKVFVLIVIPLLIIAAIIEGVLIVVFS